MLISARLWRFPIVNREIPVIADPYVDKEFGTGCVKITPAHDPNDFEVGKRHNLAEINILNDDATINAYKSFQSFPEQILICRTVMHQWPVLPFLPFLQTTAV